MRAAAGIVVNTSPGRFLPRCAFWLLLSADRVSGGVFSLNRHVEGASDLNPGPQQNPGPKDQSKSERPHGEMGSDQKTVESV